MTPQEAFTIARSFAVEILQNISDLRLEEIEKGANTWLVTLSWIDNSTLSPGGAIGTILGVKASRQYKVFDIDPTAKEVRSMKIWKNGN
jgi:hypothetical protein